MIVSHIPTFRIHKYHPKDQIIRDINSAIQTRRMINFSKENAMVCYISKQRRTNHKDYQNCLFACFLSQIEPKKVIQALTYLSWIEAMQEELLQKKQGQEYVAQVYPEEGIDLMEMDVKSVFLYGTIKDEVYMCQPLGFEGSQFPKDSLDVIEFERDDALRKIPDELYGELTFILGLQTASTPTEPNKALIKDEEAENVDVHLYRSMIGSLMYLKASRPDIIFVVCACARDSPFDLEAFSDNDYAGASLDRKSTTGGCQFLGKRLISWQCKKQAIVANSTTEEEYVVDANCYGQHNMVVYLEKSDENAEFHQIVDFLSTCSINYALTVSPTIYASYIEQFWNTATSKTVNSVKQIHAIVDGKAVVISESSVRNDLLFDDEDGITCLTNDDIFENLALMGYEQLSTKLTFQKVSHEPQTEANIEQILPSPSIYQRKHRKTQKHRRAKKVTELPQTSVPLDLGVDEVPRNHRGAPAQTRSERVLKQPNEPPLPKGHTSGSGEGRMAHTFELMDIVPPTPYDSPLPGGYTPGSDEGRLKLEELMVMCTKLSKQVLDLEKEKDAQAVEILKLKKRVKKLERHRKSSISHPRRRIYRQVESSDDDLDEEDASKQGRKSDKTKPMFKDSDFDRLDDDMENVEGETVYAATSGVSTAGALVSTARPTVSTVGPSTSAAGTLIVKIKEDEIKVASDDLRDELSVTFGLSELK
ncbi:hypothetical protein Tco_0948819, partial [Tanacetum coccineum]